MDIEAAGPIKRVAVSASATPNNTLVAAVAGKKIRVLALVGVSAGIVNAKLQSGAGGTDITGAMPLVANGQIPLQYNPAGWCETAAGMLLNLNLSAGVLVAGVLTYQEVL